MATVVANKVLDAVEALQTATIDNALESRIRELSRAQTVLPVSGPLEEEYVGSPLMRLLIDNHSSFSKTMGLSHVIYAPPSTGKTTALRFFVQELLKKQNAPALMISRIGNVRNYMENIARVLQVRDGHENASWLASLVSALTPRPGEQLQHAPVLIFDEFNMQGEDDENIFFADSFARFVYERKINVLFVSQNLEVAIKLCKLNGWQKIGPLPLLTTPQRWSTFSDDEPPSDYEWNKNRWTWSQEQLTLLILKRERFKGKFDNHVIENTLEWLADVRTPTAAIALAYRKLSEIEESVPYDVRDDLVL